MAHKAMHQAQCSDSPTFRQVQRDTISPHTLQIMTMAGLAASILYFSTRVARSNLIRSQGHVNYHPAQAWTLPGTICVAAILSEKRLT